MIYFIVGVSHGFVQSDVFIQFVCLAACVFALTLTLTLCLCARLCCWLCCWFWSERFHVAAEHEHV